MAALGARIARFHDGLRAIRDGFGRPDDYRHSVAADVRQMLEQGERLDPRDQRGAGREDAGARSSRTWISWRAASRPARSGAAMAISTCATSC